MVGIPVPAGSLAASHVHTEWTVQASKIHTASVWRLHHWTEVRKESVMHRCCRQSDHTHHWAAAGVWYQGQGVQQKQPSTCAESTQCPVGVSTAGPSGLVPGSRVHLPSSAASLWLSGFCLRPPLRSICFPKSSQRTSYITVQTSAAV